MKSNQTLTMWTPLYRLSQEAQDDLWIIRKSALEHDYLVLLSSYSSQTVVIQAKWDKTYSNAFWNSWSPLLIQLCCYSAQYWLHQLLNFLVGHSSKTDIGWGWSCGRQHPALYGLFRKKKTVSFSSSHTWNGEQCRHQRWVCLRFCNASNLPLIQTFPFWAHSLFLKNIL